MTVNLNNRLHIFAISSYGLTENSFATIDQRYTEEGSVPDIEDIVSVGRKIG